MLKTRRWNEYIIKESESYWEFKKIWMNSHTFEEKKNSLWTPSLLQLLIFPVIMFPTDGRKTMYLKMTSVCDDPSPGRIKESPMDTRSFREIQRPTFKRTWGERLLMCCYVPTKSSPYSPVSCWFRPVSLPSAWGWTALELFGWCLSVLRARTYLPFPDFGINVLCLQWKTADFDWLVSDWLADRARCEIFFQQNEILFYKTTKNTKKT